MKYVVVYNKVNRRTSSEYHVVGHMYRTKKSAEKRAKYLNEHDQRRLNDTQSAFYVRAMRMQSTVNFWNGVADFCETMREWRYDRLRRKLARMEQKYTRLNGEVQRMYQQRRANR